MNNELETMVERQIIGLAALSCTKLSKDAFRKSLAMQSDPRDHTVFIDEFPELLGKLESKTFRRAQLDNLDRWRSLGIEILPYGDERYPHLLRQMYDPPIILFVRGEKVERLNAIPCCIAIVGSRKADLKGFRFTRELATLAAARGACVVSGLAIGIDTAAHEGALESQSLFPTVAVLGHGLDRIYPSSNEKLGLEILERKGLLISQFLPGERPYPSNFLDRNRIIAALSHGVLVVQAAERSGALATARYALEEGRDVMAVPGDFDNPRHAGTNRLIKQGAHMVTSFTDLENIFSALQVVTESRLESTELLNLSESESKILSVLREEGEIHLADLVERIGGEEEGSLALLQLELKGLVERLPGNFVSSRTSIR